MVQVAAAIVSLCLCTSTYGQFIIAQYDYFAGGPGTPSESPFYTWQTHLMQTFTPTSSGTVTSVDLTANRKISVPTASLTAKIFALTDYGDGNGWQPTGSALATGSLTGSDTQWTNITWKNIPMSAVALSSGTTYGLVLDAASTHGEYSWTGKQGADYSGGNFAILSGSAYAQQSTTDMGFRINAVPEPATYAVIAGLAILGVAVWRRQRRGGQL